MFRERLVLCITSDGITSLKNHFTSCSVNAPRNSSLNSRFLCRCNCISVREEAPMSSANTLLNLEDSSSPWTDKADAELVVSHIKNQTVFRSTLMPVNFISSFYPAEPSIGTKLLEQFTESESLRFFKKRMRKTEE